jgi:hypothetical protein
MFPHMNCGPNPPSMQDAQRIRFGYDYCMAVAVKMDPGTQKRVARILKKWNEVADSGAMPLPIISKNALFRALIAWGASEYERMLGLAPPPGAGQFQSSKAHPPPFQVGRRKKVALAKSKSR